MAPEVGKEDADMLRDGGVPHHNRRQGRHFSRPEDGDAAALDVEDLDLLRKFKPLRQLDGVQLVSESSDVASGSLGGHLGKLLSITLLAIDGGRREDQTWGLWVPSERAGRAVRSRRTAKHGVLDNRGLILHSRVLHDSRLGF